MYYNTFQQALELLQNLCMVDDNHVGTYTCYFIIVCLFCMIYTHSYAPHNLEPTINTIAMQIAKNAPSYIRNIANNFDPLSVCMHWVTVFVVLTHCRDIAKLCD